MWLQSLFLVESGRQAKDWGRVKRTGARATTDTSSHMAKNYHVTRRGDSWAVVGTGNSRASSTHGTQGEAIAAARPLAQQAKSELRIHGADNRIREAWSYGNDPHPPRG